MMQRSFSLAWLSALLVLGACQTTSTTQPAPSPSDSPAASAVPSASTEPSPSPSPSANPSATPSPSASPIPSPTPTPTPEPTATPTPTPTPEPSSGDLLIQVYDDSHSAVTKSTVRVQSQTEGVDYDRTFDLNVDRVQVSGLPVPVTYLLTATAPGYNVQTRSVLVKAGQSASFVFEGNYAISDKPEVISVEPAYPAVVGVFDPIVLHFSESMDHSSVEHSIALQLDRKSESHFDVGTLIPGYTSVIARPDDTIYSERQLDLEWDDSRTLIVRPQHGWPVASENSFRLVLSFKDANGFGGVITDDNGEPSRFPSEGSEEDGPFRVGNLYHPFLPVEVKHSGIPSTELKRIIPSTNGNDSLTLLFNRELSFLLETGDEVVAGTDGAASLAPAATGEVTAQEAAQNYQLVCNDQAVTLPSSAAAVYISEDEVRISVSSEDNLFDSGDKCKLSFRGLVDVFGQQIDAVNGEGFIVP